MANNNTFRPSLACGDADWDYFAYLIGNGDTLYCSPKLDGIRAVVREGALVSRTLKQIRNRHIQDKLGTELLDGLDGELIVGAAYGDGVFQRTSSGVMSEWGEPEFTYWVFDHWALGELKAKFKERFETLRSITDSLLYQGYPEIRLLEQTIVRDVKHLEDLEGEYFDRGFEGAIVRWSEAPYKLGRSTLRERYMLKLKRFNDSEATIIGFEELTHNDNEATFDARGYTTRSSHKANKRAAGTLGKLLVRDLHKPEWEFAVGTGFDMSLRQEIWDDQDRFLGKVIKFKYLPVGTLDRPRHPVFLGFRDGDDI